MNALLKRIQFTHDISIVGFPCNQFGYQEPAANETELYNGLEYVRPGSGYRPLFSIMKKINVNGENDVPAVYTYLKNMCRAPDAAVYNSKKFSYTQITTRDIAWNFEKFIIDKFGNPRYRFLSAVTPDDLEPILKLLAGEKSAYTASISALDSCLESIEKTHTT